MANMTAFAGEVAEQQVNDQNGKNDFLRSINLLSDWLERNDYKGYDTFDGLSARYLRPFTFETKILRITLQQSVRRLIVNLRPLLGIEKTRSSKGMGFLARGFLRMYQSTGDNAWREKAESALQWLIDNQSRGYSGACWGNHFDYQSRGFFLPKGVPTIVWTSLIGHAFLDAYELLRNDRYLQIANSSCEHIIRDIATFPYGEGLCISYVPGLDSRVHNASTARGEPVGAHLFLYRRSNRIKIWLSVLFNIRLNSKGQTDRGTTARQGTNNGWTTFTPGTSLTALNTTSIQLVMIALSQQ